MPDIFKEVRVLRDEGKLHKRLITRVRMLLVISVIILAIVAFNVVTRGVGPVFAGALALGGFVFGYFLFSRMSPVQWNEEDEVVQIGRMDTLGYIILGLYIISEISLRTVLSDFIPGSATTLLLAGVFGVLFGRVIGTVFEIHRVYLASH